MAHRPPAYFDIKQHLKEWHQLALPLFVVIAAIFLILFLTLRMKNKTEQWESSFNTPDRLHLLSTEPGAVFDPAFAVLSPVDLVKAPQVSHFDYPVGSRHGALTYNAQPFLSNHHLGDDLNGIGGENSDLGDPVYAATDGLVIYAGWPADGWGNVVVLQSQLADGSAVQCVYAHLDAMTVPVGSLIRRGDQIGTIGNANGRYLAHLHFEIKASSTLDIGPGYAESDLGRISGELALNRWRNQEDDQLRSAPKATEVEAEKVRVKYQFDTPNQKTQ